MAGACRSCSRRWAGAPRCPSRYELAVGCRRVDVRGGLGVDARPQPREACHAAGDRQHRDGAVETRVDDGVVAGQRCDRLEVREDHEDRADRGAVADAQDGEVDRALPGVAGHEDRGHERQQPIDDERADGEPRQRVDRVDAGVEAVPVTPGGRGRERYGDEPEGDDRDALRRRGVAFADGFAHLRARSNRQQPRSIPPGFVDIRRRGGAGGQIRNVSAGAGLTFSRAISGMDLPDDLALPLATGEPSWYWLGGRPSVDFVNTLRERWWRASRRSSRPPTSSAGCSARTCSRRSARPRGAEGDATRRARAAQRASTTRWSPCRRRQARARERARDDRRRRSRPPSTRKHPRQPTPADAAASAPSPAGRSRAPALGAPPSRGADARHRRARAVEDPRSAASSARFYHRPPAAGRVWCSIPAAQRRQGAAAPRAGARVAGAGALRPRLDHRTSGGESQPPIMACSADRRLSKGSTLRARRLSTRGCAGGRDY